MALCYLYLLLPRYDGGLEIVFIPEEIQKGIIEDHPVQILAIFNPCGLVDLWKCLLLLELLL